MVEDLSFATTEFNVVVDFVSKVADCEGCGIGVVDLVVVLVFSVVDSKVG